jgi:hypothetical protein
MFCSLHPCHGCLQTVTFNWTTLGQIDTVDVVMRRSSSSSPVYVGRNISNTGTVTFDISETQEIYRYYRFEITAVSFPPVHDDTSETSNSFRIDYVPSSFTFISPKFRTADEFYLGNALVMRWDTEGEIPFVDITLIGKSGDLVLFTDLENVGQAQWTIPIEHEEYSYYKVSIVGKGMSPIYAPTSRKSDSFEITTEKCDFGCYTPEQVSSRVRLSASQALGNLYFLCSRWKPYL